MINSFPPDLSTLLADTWVESGVYVWLTIWLIDQDHDEWQYNNQLPWRRALSLVLSITPSVSHQPVSTAWTNVNVRSQQWLRPQFSQSEGAYLQELRQPPPIPRRVIPASDFTFSYLPQMYPAAAVSLKCVNNTLSHKTTCASDRDSWMEERRLAATFFPPWNL